jgi:hypothetical protein
VPVVVDRDDREEPRREQLLALQGLRRDLECEPLSWGARARYRVAVNRTQLARELKELITALDRRVPRVERAGEASIARDAAALRAKAVKRLAGLTLGKPSRASAAGRPSKD